MNTTNHNLLRDEILKGIHEWLKDVFDDSQAFAPVDSRRLKNSGHLELTSDGGYIEYDTAYAKKIDPVIEREKPAFRPRRLGTGSPYQNTKSSSFADSRDTVEPRAIRYLSAGKGLRKLPFLSGAVDSNLPNLGILLSRHIESAFS